MPTLTELSGGERPLRQCCKPDRHLMSGYEVPEPILNSPFDEPAAHWHIVEGEMPERRSGRRPAMYFYRDPKAKPETEAGRVVGTAIELKLVNRIR